MITKSDLQLICNYSESNTSGSHVAQISYMEFIEDEEYKRQLIRDRREKVIDAIVDNKVDEFEKFSESFGNTLDAESNIRSVSPRLMSKNLTASNFISYENLWKEVIFKLESLTSTTSKHQPIVTSGMDPDAICRRIITKCTLLSNLIASNGRGGPGRTIIVGYNVLPHLMSSQFYTSQSQTTPNLNTPMGTVAGMYVITDTIISPNKVIVIGTDSKPGVGLTVVKSINHDQYFLSDIGKWENKIEWFEVI